MKKLLLIFSAFIMISCSSAKRPMLVTAIADQADANYEEANSLISYGRYDMAKDRLDAAWKLALSIDDVELLTKLCFSYISYDLSVNDVESAEKYLDDSSLFLSRCSDANKSLLSLVYDIYKARIHLAVQENLSDDLKKLQSNKDAIKDPYYSAYLYRTMGDIHSELKDYSSADGCYLTAAQIHVKNRYLSEIGLDYYSSARVRTLKGDKTGSVASLENAIKYDKDAENTCAIGLDYFAYSKILLTGNPSTQEKVKAKNSAIWAKKVFAAGDFMAEAEKVEEFLKNLE